MSDLLIRDPELSTQLRPSSADEFIGQRRAVEILRVMNASGYLSDSMLFVGPPGLGKTTLAKMTAHRKMPVFVGGSLVSTGDALNALSFVVDGDVLFIDEIHSARKAALEALYESMEDGLRDRRGPIRAQIVAATTEPGKLPPPLLDRFGQVVYLDYYSEEELVQIMKRASKILGMSDIDDIILQNIALRARGTPRIANRMLKRLKDIIKADSEGSSEDEDKPIQVTEESLTKLWDLLEIDNLGLTRMDRNVLNLLARQRKPIGIQVIARNIGIDAGTLERMTEPQLLRLGLIEIASTGRSITMDGYQHIAEDLR